jgi:hypothetical protein
MFTIVDRSNLTVAFNAVPTPGPSGTVNVAQPIAGKARPRPFFIDSLDAIPMPVAPPATAPAPWVWPPARGTTFSVSLPIAKTGAGSLCGGNYEEILNWSISNVNLPQKNQYSQLVIDATGSVVYQPSNNQALVLPSNQEVVTVSATPVVGGNACWQFKASYAMPHAARFAISNALLGNPGPQSVFDPRNPTYSGIVRYFNIIE